jgi:hypothetical protein
MSIRSASIHRAAGRWRKEKGMGTLNLDFDARHRRRIRLTAAHDEDVRQNVLSRGIRPATTSRAPFLPRDMPQLFRIRGVHLLICLAFLYFAGQEVVQKIRHSVTKSGNAQVFPANRCDTQGCDETCELFRLLAAQKDHAE